jgi:hypothetical protein
MKNILIQFDTDERPSAFDRVVAIDSGVDELFSYGGISPVNVESFVHGAIFTRSPKDLQHTGIFIGGSQVAEGEALLKKVNKSFFGPMRVSVMIDSNGSNTTAAAAVLAAKRHLPLAGLSALVLGGTGPVGHRVAQILASQGSSVRVASRIQARAQQTCDAIQTVIPDAKLIACSTNSGAELDDAIAGVTLIVAAGAAAVELLSEAKWRTLSELKVLIDLNAVPPLGIGGIQATDKGVDHYGVICYGALGVGGMKMKIHKAAINKLFEANNQILDTAAIYTIAEAL